MLLPLRFRQILSLTLFFSALNGAEFNLLIPRGPNPERMGDDGYMSLNLHFTPTNSSEKWGTILSRCAKVADQKCFIHALITDTPGIFSFYYGTEEVKLDPRWMATHTIKFKGGTPVITHSRWSTKNAYLIHASPSFPIHQSINPSAANYTHQYYPGPFELPSTLVPHQNFHPSHHAPYPGSIPVVCPSFPPTPSLHLPPHIGQNFQPLTLPICAHPALSSVISAMYTDLNILMAQQGGPDGTINYLRALIASPNLPPHHLAKVVADLALLLQPPAVPTPTSCKSSTESTPAHTSPTQTARPITPPLTSTPVLLVASSNPEASPSLSANAVSHQLEPFLSKLEPSSLPFSATTPGADSSATKQEVGAPVVTSALIQREQNVSSLVPTPALAPTDAQASSSSQHEKQTAQRAPAASQISSSPASGATISGPNTATAAPIKIVPRKTSTVTPVSPAAPARNTTVSESFHPTAIKTSTPSPQKSRGLVAAEISASPQKQISAATSPTPAPVSKQRQVSRPSAEIAASFVTVPTISKSSEAYANSSGTPAAVKKSNKNNDDNKFEFPVSTQPEIIKRRRPKKSNSENQLIRKARLALERTQRENIEKIETTALANLMQALNENNFVTMQELLENYDTTTPLGKKLVCEAVSYMLAIFTDDSCDLSFLCRHIQDLLAADSREHHLTQSEQQNLHALLGRKLPDPAQRAFHQITAAGLGHVDSQAQNMLDSINAWEQNEGLNPDTCKDTSNCPHKQARTFLTKHQNAQTFPCLILQAALLRAVWCPHSGCTILHMDKERAVFLANATLQLRNTLLSQRLKEELERPLPIAHQASIKLLNTVMSDIMPSTGNLTCSDTPTEEEFEQLHHNLLTLAELQDTPPTVSLTETIDALIKRNLSPQQFIRLFTTPIFAPFFPQFYEEAYDGSEEAKRFHLTQEHHRTIAQGICKHVPHVIQTLKQYAKPYSFYEYIFTQSKTYLETGSFPPFQEPSLRVKIENSSSDTPTLTVSADQFVDANGVIDLDKLTQRAFANLPQQNTPLHPDFARAAVPIPLSAAQISSMRTDLLRLLESTQKNSDSQILKFIDTIKNTTNLLMICQQKPGAEESLKRLLPLLAEGTRQNRWTWFTWKELHILCEDLKQILTVRKQSQIDKTRGKKLIDLQSFITAFQFKEFENKDSVEAVRNGITFKNPLIILREESLSALPIGKLFQDLTRRQEILSGISIEQVTSYIATKPQKLPRSIRSLSDMTTAEKAELKEILDSISSHDQLNKFLTTKISTVLKELLSQIKTPQDVADFYAILKAHASSPCRNIVTTIFEELILTLPSAQQELWKKCTRPVFNTLLLEQETFERVFRSFCEEIEIYFSMIEQTPELVSALLDYSINIAQGILALAKTPDEFTCVLTKLNEMSKNIPSYVVILSAVNFLESIPLTEQKQSLLCKQLPTIIDILRVSHTLPNVSLYTPRLEALRIQINEMSLQVPDFSDGAAAQAEAIPDIETCSTTSIEEFTEIFKKTPDKIIPMVQISKVPINSFIEPLVWIAILQTEVLQPDGSLKSIIDLEGTRQRLNPYRIEFLEKRLDALIESAQNQNLITRNTQLLKLREDLYAWNTLNLESNQWESPITNRFITPIMEATNRYCGGSETDTQPRQEAIDEVKALLKTIDPKQADFEARSFIIALTLYGGFFAQTISTQLAASGYVGILPEVVSVIRQFAAMKAPNKRLKTEGSFSEDATATTVSETSIPKKDFVTPLTHAAAAYSIGKDDVAKETALVEIATIAQTISRDDVPLFALAICTHALLIKVPAMCKILKSEAILPAIKHALVTQLAKSNYVSQPDMNEIQAAYRSFVTASLLKQGTVKV